MFHFNSLSFAVILAVVAISSAAVQIIPAGINGNGAVGGAIDVDGLLTGTLGTAANLVGNAANTVANTVAGAGNSVAGALGGLAGVVNANTGLNLGGGIVGGGLLG
ncbi:uncharacterized protein LOC129909510 [Episyrphus balteatus]|uniref:uncharacterized protein LOC129909510 n=1 Tax=Episyrphus balteatus TaxID=286459 RepID=UPI002485F47F|nr:uncharacterized protein LOC129909510 [Episyrphus balteatus]